MRKIFLMSFASLIACSVLAGVGGIMVKGVVKTWDEIARIALKASGKPVTDDAVKSASKVIENAASKYGDDIAEASMRGGVEVAEQSLKQGQKFILLLKKASVVSADAVKSIAVNSDDALQYTAKYGDDVVRLGSKTPLAISLVEKSGVENARKVVSIMATEIPPEQTTQLLGAVQRNPTVSRQLFDGVARGGKYFVDKLFALNAKQILAGTLGAAAIEGVVRKTRPDVERGKNISKDGDTTRNLIKNGGKLTDEQQKFVAGYSRTTSIERIIDSIGNASTGIVIAIFAGISMLLFVIHFNKKLRGERPRAEIRSVDDYNSSPKAEDKRDIETP